MVSFKAELNKLVQFRPYIYNSAITTALIQQNYDNSSMTTALVKNKPAYRYVISYSINFSISPALKLHC